MGEVKFEKVAEYQDIDFDLPVRKTGLSAGYDFMLPEDIIIPSHYTHLLKLLTTRLGSKDFLEELEKTKVIKELIAFGANPKAFTEENQAKIVAQLIDNMPEMLEILKQTFTLDLEDVKEMTKNTDTRMTLVPTGVKAKLKDNQRLELLIRSSTPLGAYLMMANSVGLIDADYYNNIGNEGHIYFQLINLSPFNIRLKKGDIVGQGVISSYDKTTDDSVAKERVGGFGSNN